MINVGIKFDLVRVHISIKGRHTDNFPPLPILHFRIFETFGTFRMKCTPTMKNWYSGVKGK